MTERDRLIQKMGEAIYKATQDHGMSLRRMADAALRVIESPPDPAEKPTRICTCGQNGYPENHWNSNHPHTEDCPQWTGPKS